MINAGTILTMIILFVLAILTYCAWHNEHDFNSGICDRALADGSPWAQDPDDRFWAEKNCPTLLDARIEPCTRYPYGPDNRGDSFFCGSLDGRLPHNNDKLGGRSLVTAYAIKRGDHGELVEIGMFPGSEVTFY